MPLRTFYLESGAALVEETVQPAVAAYGQQVASDRLATA
jgi:hypothetical protein